MFLIPIVFAAMSGHRGAPQRQAAGGDRTTPLQTGGKDGAGHMLDVAGECYFKNGAGNPRHSVG
jgi:hypothetical protein